MSRPASASPSRAADRLRALRLRNGGRLGALLSALLWALVAAILLLIAAGRVVSAPPMPLAAGIVFLPYEMAALVLFVLLCWVLLPDRRSIPAALIALAALSAAIWGPRWGGDGPVVEGESVRVMSWNLRRLWGGPNDGGDAVKCAVQAISEAKPDVLTLLEVSANDVDKLEELIPGLSCVQHPYQEGGAPKTGGLAACTLGERWRMKGGEGQRYVDDQDWYYVFSEVQRGEDVFNVLAIHLSPYQYVAKKIRTSVDNLSKGKADALADVTRQSEEIVKGQSDQSAALVARVEKFVDPTLLGGDFNSTRDSALHASLRQHLKDSWELGGFGFGGTVELFDYFPLRIDYIYASHEFRVNQTSVLEMGCSDHRPVVTDLTLKARGGS